MRIQVFVATVALVSAASFAAGWLVAERRRKRGWGELARGDEDKGEVGSRLSDETMGRIARAGW